MRPPLVLVALAVSTCFVVPAGAGDTPPSAKTPSATPAPREVIRWKITYRTKFSKPADGTERLEAWIPVPYQDDLQKVEDLKVDAAVPTEVTTAEVSGNRMVHVLVEKPTADVEVAWTAIVRRQADHGQGKGPWKERHLAPDKMAPIDGVAARLAKDLGVDDASKPVRERSKTIYDHVLKSMTYDKETPGWGKGDLERAVTVCKGNCSDFASEFIAIARAAGIPSRWVSSISFDAEHAKCGACGYHCYAQFREGDAWIPVDPSDARRVVAKDPKKAAWFFGNVPANAVILTVGRDLALAPAQKGGPVNFFGGPYLEVDGKPTDVPAANRTYDYEEVDDAATAATPVTPAKKDAEPKKEAAPAPAAK